MDDRSIARTKVWSALRSVALPDSRFHFDFSEFITDFQGSGQATARLIQMDIYKNARAIFITPDNCLELLRSQTVRDKKIMLMTTYGIRRGFVELLPEDVPSGLEDYAVLLDAIEKIGRHISLAEIQKRYKIDLLVTGGSAVTRTGGRLGKGHGYFDIEWATLYSIGAVEINTPIVDVVHDCQLVDDELKLTPYDTTCDYIVTPTQVIHVPTSQKPTGGIYWNQLAPGMMENISILAELNDLDKKGKLRTTLKQ
jgi:5-formyltetrahydrofolate cyclo-ligase